MRTILPLLELKWLTNLFLPRLFFETGSIFADSNISESEIQTAPSWLYGTSLRRFSAGD